MLVLGRNSDDKGTQLETLTTRILEYRGYSEIIRNYISSGGEEIDVRAVLPAPGVAAPYPVTMICECKAYRTPVSMSDWLKFLGKIFVEQTKGGPQTAGTFIALSGVNGNVSGNYADVKQRRSDIMMVTGAELRSTVEEIFGAANLDHLTEIVRRSTSRSVRHVEEAYYDGRVYWVVAFEDDAFTMVQANGSSLSPEEVDRLVPMVAATLDVAQYVDLEEEAAALVRRGLISKAVLASLLRDAGVPTPDDLINTVANVGPRDISQATADLAEATWIAENRDDAGANQFVLERAPAAIIEMYRFLLAGRVPRDVVVLFASPAHAGLVRDVLLPAVIETQHVILDAEQSSDAARILQWSPSALAWALTPDSWLQHSQPSDELGRDIEQLQRTRAAYFHRRLYSHLQTDFRHTATRGLFLREHGIERIETTQHIVVHGKDGVELDRKLYEGMRVGVLADGLVGPDGSDVVNMIELESLGKEASPQGATEDTSTHASNG